MSWGLGWETDPYQIWHSSQAVDKGSNFVGFKDAEADKLIEEARKEFDPEKRRKPPVGQAKTPPQPALEPRPALWRLPDLWICLLLGATLAVYARCGHFAFVNYDDPVYVTNNPHVRRDYRRGRALGSYFHRSRQLVSGHAPLAYAGRAALRNARGLAPSR